MILLAAALTYTQLVASAGVDASALFVLPPVGVADAGGRSVDASTLQKATEGVLDAARAKKARVHVRSTTMAPPAPSLPADLAALAASARQAAEELDTKNGVRLHRDLIEKLGARLGEIGDTQPLADARLSLASVYLGTNEAMLAKTELDAAARLRPNADLDLSRWSPALAEAFTAAQARVRAEPGADLDVKEEAGTVYVDGVRVGEAPLTLPVRRGKHLVWVGAVGHVPLVRVVDVEPGSRTRVDDALVGEASWDLAQRLAGELGDGRRAEAVGLARALAKEEAASVVVVTGVVPVSGGIAVLMSRAEDEPRLAVVTLDSALTSASTALAAGLDALQQPAAAFSGGVARVRGEHAPDPDDVKVDAKRSLLGLTAAHAVVATAHVGDKTLTTAPPPPPPSVTPPEESGFPWVWVAGGAVVVAAAAAVAGAAYLNLLPFSAVSPPVQDPDTTALTIVVAP